MQQQEANHHGNILSQSATSSDLGTAVLPPRAAPTLVELRDLEYSWRAHQESPREDASPFRKFDPHVPYAVHPAWCAFSIAVEPNLPQAIRMLGARVLPHHDVLEDTGRPLPDWLSATERKLINAMTFAGGSAEEREVLFSRSPIVRLFKLYDKVSNLMDGVWMDDARIQAVHPFVADLARDVEHHYPGLNITKFARSLLNLASAVPPAPETEVRISVGNLVTKLTVDGEEHYFGLLNRKQFERGNRVFSAVGGAAELTELGMRHVQEQFGAQLQEGKDARFLTTYRHVPEIQRLVIARNSSLFETGADRELCEELTGTELKGLPPVLTADQLARTAVRHVTTLQQPLATGGSSARQTEIPSARIFGLFELQTPRDVYEALKSHPAIHIFTDSELATTRGGVRVGETVGDETIANNIFPFSDLEQIK